MQKVYVLVLLLGSIITVNVADPEPASGEKKSSSSNKKIFQPAGDSTIDQIAGTSTPWVLPDLIPTIHKFKKNVFKGLKSCPYVKKIWHMKTESKETRTIYFDILNKLLDDIGHPAPAALANIVSKCGSLFKPMTMQVYFETDATHLAEFLLSKGIKIKRDTAKKYVDSISKALESADTNNKLSVWQAILTGYDNFVVPFGFKLVDVIDELLILFSGELIVLHDK